MRDPELKGIGGKAWLVTQRRTKDQSACLVAWLLVGGWHPLWTYWLISVVHLRPIEGVKAAHKDYEAAEYEVIIASLESPPSCPDVHPDPDNLGTIKFLTPLDFGLQFDGVSDESARQVADQMVEIIIDGRASPDVDFLSYWVKKVPMIVESLKKKGN